MSIVKRVLINLRTFLIDYCERHKHPVNAILHIFGVPIAFWGIFRLFQIQTFQIKNVSGLSDLGFSCILIFIGYLLQYLGHRAQGNEVGEVILAKKIFLKLKRNN